MTAELVCYRCGASIAALSLPLSRRDLCPGCSTELHVCRMCRHYDSQVPAQCREEDAEEVHNKENGNFCDWFQPLAGVFDSARAAEQGRAKAELDSLFGDGPDNSNGDSDDGSLGAAHDLFK